MAALLARRWGPAVLRSPLQVTCFSALQLHVCGPAMRASQKDFENAVNQMKLLKKDPGNEVKLQLYALYKQATEGPCNVPKPGMLDFVSGAKWDAWSALGSLPKETARQNYVDLVSSLSASSESSSQVTPGVDGKQLGSDAVVVTSKDGITTITLNRPERKNALTTQMYHDIMLALQAASKDDSTITVLTGSGDYYSSGNDLTNFMDTSPGDVKEKARSGAILLRDFVDCFIDFPKPLVAVINGPAVGISVTILGLFDIVYATDREHCCECSPSSLGSIFQSCYTTVIQFCSEIVRRPSKLVNKGQKTAALEVMQATFHTPFSNLGQSPEGCSSYTFPKIMGPSKATEMLIFGKKLTAQEARAQGLVTEVFPDSTFQKEVWARLKAYSKLPPNAVKISKQIIRHHEKEKLHAINAKESSTLQERWLSDECVNAVVDFLSKRAKL